ncbi:hypothetical protein GCM10010169_33920 [Micromonospora fulviviridis]|nr:hypothetical protein GCM10010169_33920 [Micromonospora fulviviridis]
MALAALAGAVVAGPAAAAAPPSPAPAATVLVQLPAGASLPPGRYEVVLRGGGRQLAGTGTVVTPSPAVAPAAPGPGVRGLLAGALTLVVLAAVLYLTQRAFRVPFSRRREYEDLVRLLDAGDAKAAVTGLTRVEAQLPQALRVKARFFIGYGLYQLGELDEAEHRLAALHREEPDDPSVAYLLAYLRVQRRDFDGAEPVLAALARRNRLDIGQARRLYGIVLFQQATQAVTDGRVDAAADLFDRVEQLGDFSDRIPVDLRSRHTVIGARALLDRDLPAARRQFEELAKAADSGDLLVSAKLGLALVAWLEDEPGSPRRVADLLTECLRVLYPRGPVREDWPGPPSDDLAGRLEELSALGDQPPARQELRQSLRDIYLLRALAVMRMWTENDVDPAKAGAFVEACARRFACAVRLDRQFADPYLLVGMLRYRLAAGDPHGRRQAVAELRAAQILGVRRPEVLRIVRDHEDRERVRDQGYTALLHRLAGPGAASPDPETARRHQRRFGRAPNRDTPADGVAPGTAPTVTELSERAELLTAKLENVQGALGGDAAEAADLARKLAQDTAALTERARAIEEGEAALLALLGARLKETEA